MGQRLTVDAGGRLRALRSVEVEGVALEEGDSDGDGLVWVLVNPQ